jgi:hypothetical protein
MKKILVLLLCAVAFGSCRKDMAKEISPTSANTNTLMGVEPLPDYRWTKITNTYPNSYPYSWLESPNLMMQVSEDDVYFMSGSLLDHKYRFIKSSKTWQPHTTTNSGYMGFSVFSVGFQYLFSYNNKIYQGLMQGGPDFNESAFASLDPVTGVTNGSIAAFPGITVDRPVSFVAGDKGYIFSGYNSTTPSKIWEYNFAADTWTNRGNSPIGKRKGAVSFVVNNKVYVGLGYENATLNGQTLKIYIKDWIEYDPATGVSTPKATFPGAARGNATGFVIGSSIYMGFGKGINGYFKDFWKYSTTSNTWTQQDNWPGVTQISNNMVGFSQGSTGYVIKAALNEFWQFSRSSIIPMPNP